MVDNILIKMNVSDVFQEMFVESVQLRFEKAVRNEEICGLRILRAQFLV